MMDSMNNKKRRGAHRLCRYGFRILILSIPLFVFSGCKGFVEDADTKAEVSNGDPPIVGDFLAAQPIPLRDTSGQQEDSFLETEPDISNQQKPKSANREK